MRKLESRFNSLQVVQNLTSSLFSSLDLSSFNSLQVVQNLGVNPAKVSSFSLVSIPYRQSRIRTNIFYQKRSCPCFNSLQVVQNRKKAKLLCFSQLGFNSLQVVQNRAFYCIERTFFVQFQFLIGSLESLKSGQPSCNGQWFQFLIGSLESVERFRKIVSELEFQFLIGSLESLSWCYGKNGRYCVSIPYRQSRINSDLDFEGQVGNGFNSLQVVQNLQSLRKVDSLLYRFNSLQVVQNLAISFKSHSFRVRVSIPYRQSRIKLKI